VPAITPVAHCPPLPTEPSWLQKLVTRIAADQHQRAALYNSLVYIESKQSRCHSGLWRERFNHKALQDEMLSPILVARIEQRNKLACFDIGRTDVATLPKVATQAGIGQILRR